MPRAFSLSPFPGQRGEGYFVVNAGSNPVIRSSDEIPLPVFLPGSFGEPAALLTFIFRGSEDRNSSLQTKTEVRCP